MPMPGRSTDTPALKPRIHVVTLGVSDLQRALAFYRDGLGLPSRGIVGTDFTGDEEHPAGDAAMFTLEDGLILSLYPSSELAKDAGLTLEPAKDAGVTLESANDAGVTLEPRPGPGMSIGHIVDSREGVDRVLELAGRAGAEVLGPPHDRPWGIYSGYFRDPDGHLWEVLCVLEREGTERPGSA